MTATEFAAALNGKRFAKGKWMARCPVHKGSRLSIREGSKVPFVLYCWGGCSANDILRAMGLKWSDVLGPSTPEIKQRQSLQGRWELLNLRFGAIRLCQVIDRANRRYWEAAEKRLIHDMEPLYWELMPDMDRFNRIREFELKELRLKRLDWLRERESNGPHRAIGGPQLPSI